jgi:ATP-dependent exoDNAse (exonuclease V) beta subunit
LRDENGEAIVEYPLFSERLGYAGTVDAVFISDSKLLIVDWKTTVVEMEYWRYQTAAYERLLQEVFPGIVRTCTAVTREAVRFHDAGFESVRRERNPEDWIVFQSALNLRKALL